MKVIWMAVRDPNVRRLLDALNFFWRQRVIEGPTAEIASTPQPGVRCEYGAAVNFELDRRVSQRFERK